jgi:hypothetical protein
MSGLTSGIAEMLTSSADGVRNMAGLVQNHRGAAFLVVVQVTTCILFYFIFLLQIILLILLSHMLAHRSTRTTHHAPRTSRTSYPA